MSLRFTLPDELKESVIPDPESSARGAMQGKPEGQADPDFPLRLRALAGAGLPEWLAAARDRWRAGARDDAEALTRAAVAAFPGESQAVLDHAAVLRALGDSARADAMLGAHADQFPVALAWGGILRGRGAFDAACRIVDQSLQAGPPGADSYMQGCRFLEACSRQDLAFQACERRIDAGCAEAEDFANSARLATQLGEFELARARYERAVSAGLDPGTWHVAEALATCQRYTDAGHPDMGLFREWLRRPDLDAAGRAGVLFALGKASDDLALYADAARFWHDANALALGDTRWDAAGWRTLVDGQIARSWAKVRDVRTDWVPIFVIGMPRSGTTLVAELLGSRAGVRNRGELMFIPQLAAQVTRRAAEQDPGSLEEAAEYYRRMVVRDDAPARWYIDKQTFNFQHLGMIAALFPQAHVVHCKRDPRDAALSIWGQHFGADGPRFIYDLDAIADVTRGCERLMAHWRNTLSLPIHVVAYEELVSSPRKVIASLCDRIGIGGHAGGGDDVAPAPGSAVKTASMWQVRQPISARAVGRWRNYAEFIPGLVTKFADAPPD